MAFRNESFQVILMIRSLGFTSCCSVSEEWTEDYLLKYIVDLLKRRPSTDHLQCLQQFKPSKVSRNTVRFLDIVDVALVTR